ncbi:MAG TPA: tetratricopeptide repeat protein [Ktedonobacterales bacterium]|nr:tetratricopeptide repeat protein [Ktedonobacterales bacterium]
MSQATNQPEERARQQRQLTEQAINLALESKWEEAVAVNRQLQSLFPRDLSTLNRLGKALSELGQYAEARQAYGEALEIDPTNNIARKNLDRLAALGDGAAAPRTSHERLDPRLFIEETGKTGFTELLDVAPRQVLVRLTAGDQVYLSRDGNVLGVLNGARERIGRIEPRLASRLIAFMEGGNQYAAGIAELRAHDVRIIIRETFQHPSQFGKVSFPAQGGGEIVRAYTKESLVRHNDEEDEYNEDGEYVDDGDDDEMEDLHETDLEEADLAEPEE